MWYALRSILLIALLAAAGCNPEVDPDCSDQPLVCSTATSASPSPTPSPTGLWILPAATPTPTVSGSATPTVSPTPSPSPAPVELCQTDAHCTPTEAHCFDAVCLPNGTCGTTPKADGSTPRGMDGIFCSNQGTAGHWECRTEGASSAWGFVMDEECATDDACLLVRCEDGFGCLYPENPNPPDTCHPCTPGRRDVPCTGAGGEPSCCTGGTECHDDVYGDGTCQAQNGRRFCAYIIVCD